MPGVTQQQMLSYSQLLDEFTEKMKAKGYEARWDKRLCLLQHFWSVSHRFGAQNYG